MATAVHAMGISIDPEGHGCTLCCNDCKYGEHKCYTCGAVVFHDEDTCESCYRLEFDRAYYDGLGV